MKGRGGNRWLVHATRAREHRVAGSATGRPPGRGSPLPSQEVHRLGARHSSDDCTLCRIHATTTSEAPLADSVRTPIGVAIDDLNTVHVICDDGTHWMLSGTTWEPASEPIPGTQFANTFKERQAKKPGA